MNKGWFNPISVSVLLILITVSVWITSCSQKRSQDLDWIPFTWESGTDWGKYIDKMAIYVPVTIDELPYKFIMQLDLGTYTTVFYLNTFKLFHEKHPSLKNKWNGSPWVKNVDLKLGKVVFSGIDVGLFPKKTALTLDSINAATEIEIGTIGADLFQEKMLIIDYKLNRLAIVDSLPAEYQHVSFENFKKEDGLIKIPFHINGNIEYLMFDTGASYFSLATTKQNALAIGGTEIIDSLKVETWGNRWITFYGLETVAPVMFGTKTLDNSIVYYADGEGFDDLYQSQNIWGLTGNGYFLNDVIIIDYKNNLFGVK
jgi:hypothetical protein